MAIQSNVDLGMVPGYKCTGGLPFLLLPSLVEDAWREGVVGRGRFATPAIHRQILFFYQRQGTPG